MGMTREELAEEVRRWFYEPAPSGFVDAPEAVPRAAEAEELKLTMPKKLIVILKEFARREQVSVDVLVKRWLDSRIEREATELRYDIERRRQLGLPSKD